MRFIIPVLLIAATLPASAQRATEKHLGHDVLARQVIVKLKSPSEERLRELRQLGDADSLRPLGGSPGVYLLHSRSGSVPAARYPEVERTEEGVL